MNWVAFEKHKPTSGKWVILLRSRTAISACLYDDTENVWQTLNIFGETAGYLPQDSDLWCYVDLPNEKELE